MLSWLKIDWLKAGLHFLEFAAYVFLLVWGAYWKDKAYRYEVELVTLRQTMAQYEQLSREQAEAQDRAMERANKLLDRDSKEIAAMKEEKVSQECHKAVEWFKPKYTAMKGVWEKHP